MIDANIVLNGFEQQADQIEAHWIRNQETEQFRAANTLHAYRRWCLTGTPIQNRLEDLLALLRFLKNEPNYGKSPNVAFKRIIVDPILANHRDPCKNLRDLLRSICLRRTSQNHAKLTATHDAIKVCPSEVEKCHYERIHHQFRENMDIAVSTGQQGQNFTKLFSIILKLRMLCNHGLYLERRKSPSQVSTTSLISTIQMGNDTECDVCHNQEYSNLIKNSEVCPACARLLQSSPSDSDSTPKAPRRKRLKVTSCSSRSTLDKQAALVSNLAEPHLGNKNHFDRYPTKLLAIAKNLEEHTSSSKRSGHNSFWIFWIGLTD